MVTQFASRNNWCQVMAFAWIHSDVLTDLRIDPKGTIEELAKGTSGKYTNVDKTTASNARSIKEQADESPLEDYAGYLPLPNPPSGLESLDLKVLKNLIEAGGLTGIIQCDRSPEEWANVFKFAWSDIKNLKNIRQDPLKYLPEPEKDKLLKTEHGIFPLPGRPKGLVESIEELTNFLGDQDSAEHLGGIFRAGT